MLAALHTLFTAALRAERRIDPFIRPPFDPLRHGLLTRLVQAMLNMTRKREPLTLAQEERAVMLLSFAAVGLAFAIYCGFQMRVSQDERAWRAVPAVIGSCYGGYHGWRVWPDLSTASSFAAAQRVMPFPRG